MVKMVKKMEISNRSSNRKGRTITVYLRAEHLATLQLLSKYYKKNRSETIQFILEQFQWWFDLMIPIVIEKGKLDIQVLMETLKEKVRSY
jgi:hypothetical protein